MDRDELLALADRVEALTGPDREVDALVGEAFGVTPKSKNIYKRNYYPRRLVRVDLIYPRHTASLDAAMSLASDDTELVDLLDEAREYTGRQGWSTGDFAGQLARNFVAEKLRALAAQQPSGAMTGE